MKRLFVFFVFVVAALTSFAQKYTETVYLKNGSIIKGIIVEEIPGKSLKIQTNDGSLFVCTMNEIEKITKNLSNNTQNAYNPSSDMKTGFKSYFDFGYVIGNKNGGRLEATASIGSQLNQYFFVGGGLGCNYYTPNDFFTFPIFFDGRIYVPTGTTVHPFLNIRPGFGLSTTTDYDGGFYISTLAGIEFNKFTVGIGYSSQSFSEEYYNSYTHSAEDYRFNTGGFTIKVGISF